MDFTQRTYSQDGELLEIATGSFLFSRSGRIRWQVDEPYPQVIVSKGRQAAVYEPDLEQLIMHEIGGASTSIGEVLSLTPDRLLEIYALSLENGEFVLEPMSDSETFKVLKLRFSEKDLVGIVVEDKLDSRTEFEFSNMKSLASVDPSEFLIDVPKGTDIVGDASGFIRP